MPLLRSHAVQIADVLDDGCDDPSLGLIRERFVMVDGAPDADQDMSIFYAGTSARFDVAEGAGVWRGYARSAVSAEAEELVTTDFEGLLCSIRLWLGAVTRDLRSPRVDP